MLIAQAPGEHEDREGRMFIGPSGKVLDELLDTVLESHPKLIPFSKFIDDEFNLIPAVRFEMLRKYRS